MAFIKKFRNGKVVEPAYVDEQQQSQTPPVQDQQIPQQSPTPPTPPPINIVPPQRTRINTSPSRKGGCGCGKK